MNTDFKFSDKFAVRRPYYNYLDTSLSADSFSRIIRTNTFRKAILYASPELYGEFDKYLNNRLSPEKSDRMRETLYKYLSRMTYRCTPFGLFALCGTGNFATKTHIATSTNSKEHCRFDFELIYLVTQKVISEADSTLISGMSVVCNQSIQIVKNEIFAMIRNSEGQMSSVKIKANDLIKSIIKLTQKPLSVKKLISALSQKYDIVNVDIHDYLKRLILEGILICDIQPRTVTADNFLFIYRKLKNSRIPIIAVMHKFLNDFISEDDADVKYHLLLNLQNILKDYGITIPLNGIIQVDALLTENTTINFNVKKLVDEWFTILSNIVPPNGSPLSNFINRFSDRYESRKVALFDAINPATGIGYSGYAAPQTNLPAKVFSKPAKFKKTKTYYKSYSLSIIEEIILEKVRNANLLNTKSIELSHEDFSRYLTTENNLDLPCSLTCLYKIVGYNNDGPVIDNIRLSGPSSSYMLTRFADSSKKIETLIRESVNREEIAAEGKILAEISHLTRPKSGNVQIRPIMRKYTIPYASFAGDNPTVTAIDLSDLYLYVEHGRLKLYSKKLNKEVIPCFTSAYNYQHNSSDIYKLLGDIQLQSSNRSFVLYCDSLLSLLGHIPRVSYKNIIIFPETWQLKKCDFSDGKIPSTAKFTALCNNLNMPRYLSFAQGDNVYTLDLESQLSISDFFSLLKQYDIVSLEEMLPLASDLKHYESTLEVIQPYLPA